MKISLFVATLGLGLLAACDQPFGMAVKLNPAPTAKTAQADEPATARYDESVPSATDVFSEQPQPVKPSHSDHELNCLSIAAC